MRNNAVLFSLFTLEQWRIYRILNYSIRTFIRFVLNVLLFSQLVFNFFYFLIYFNLLISIFSIFLGLPNASTFTWCTSPHPTTMNFCPPCDRHEPPFFSYPTETFNSMNCCRVWNVPKRVKRNSGSWSATPCRHNSFILSLSLSPIRRVRERNPPKIYVIYHHFHPSSSLHHHHVVILYTVNNFNNRNNLTYTTHSSIQIDN